MRQRGLAWLITSVASVIVLVLLARLTTWGRQFWRVTGGYFRGRESVIVHRPQTGVTIG
jgi:putative ATP-binding cassette transporter